MVPETVAGADHNWAERMTMTTTNVEILRQGWLDAASALAPGLETLPELLEHGLEAAVMDERLDEQSLLRVVTDVTTAAANSLPAEELYFLTRRLQRAVYEYLLSLDALPEPPPRRESANGHAVPDTTLIGAEEVAALGRSSAPQTVTTPAQQPAFDGPPQASEPVPTTKRDAETAPERESAVEQAAVAPTPEAPPESAPPVATPEPSAAVEQAVAAEPVVEPIAEPEPEAAAAAEPVGDTHAAPSSDHPTRPAFTLFRRTGAGPRATHPAAEDNGHAHAEPGEATETVTPHPNGFGAAHADTEAAEGEPFVAPRDGFHLSELADFTVVERGGDPSAPVEIAELPELSLEPAAEQATATAGAAPAETDASVSATAPAPTRGWRLRDDETEQGQDTNSTAAITDDSRFETDPEVVEARLEINDRLRRRRCDEAAALLQRLASDVGGRALADLALDAGDRCRALGKGNAALSCYLAASRADPVHETPLLRLADICIDDHDIDLAVSYLERVTRLRRLRNDDKGALKLYRKIVTIAPYRDDILAMLMRAQSNGRFDE